MKTENHIKSQGWARTKPAARAFCMSSPCVQLKHLCKITLLFQDISRKPDWKCSSWTWTKTYMECPCCRWWLYQQCHNGRPCYYFNKKTCTENCVILHSTMYDINKAPGQLSTTTLSECGLLLGNFTASLFLDGNLYSITVLTLRDIYLPFSQSKVGELICIF